MQVFLVVLCVVSAVLGHHGKNGNGYEKTPGCENYDSVKDVKPDTCCPDRPNLIKKEMWKTCKDSGSKGDMCGRVSCAMKAANIANAEGNFDATKAKAALTAAVKNDAKWPISKMVDDCVAQTPALAKEWEEKMSKKNSTKKSCPKPDFITLKCIERSTVLSCPDWSTSEDCGKLLAFAKSCPRYDGHGCKHGKKDKSGHKNKSSDKKEGTGESD